jgi:hypothetical protein
MIDEYDDWVDRILMSEEFQNCKNKDEEDECLLTEGHPKCWHIDECPDGKERV